MNRFFLLGLASLLLVSCAEEKAPFDKDFKACLEKFDESDRRYESEELSACLNKAMVGKQLPDWEFTDLNGNSFSLHSIKSPVVILNFNSFRGEGYKYIGALHKWTYENNEDLFVIINCMADEDQIRRMAEPSWAEQASGHIAPSPMALGLTNPSLHIVPAPYEMSADRNVEYVNAVNIDDPVCSIYYIDKQHKVAHFDPYYFLIDGEADLWNDHHMKYKDSTKLPEIDYAGYTYDFIKNRIDTYLLK